MISSARASMWRTLIALATGVVLVLPVVARAQPGAPSAADSTAPAAISEVTLGADPAQDSLAATASGGRSAEEYLAQVRANFTGEAKAYWTKNVTLNFVGIGFGIVVALAFLFSGLSARIRDFAHLKARGRYGRMLIYLTIYTLLSFVISFPLSWYQGFALEHQYQLSNQSFGAWFGDELKGLGIGIVMTAVIPLVMLAYLAIEKVRLWWVALAIGSVPVIVILTLLQPIVIDPMFNKFTPLKDQGLKQQIVELAAKAGIPGRNVYQVDKSAQTNKFNAYVTGFGASQRIVLWDTTLQGMEQDEILFVMGHEMGHYRLGHIWKGIGFFSVVSFGLFFLSGVMMTWAVRRFGAQWGFRELHDVASLPLFGLALSLVSLVVQPASNFYTRSIEHQSDTFGLEVTRMNDAGARAFIKLGSQNKSNPEPPAALKWFLYSHPPLVERVRYAMEYRPWEEGKPNAAFHPKE